MRRVLLGAAAATLLLALGLATPVHAHVSTPSQAIAMEAGPFTAYLAPKPVPVFEEERLALELLVARQSGNDPTVPARLVVATPEGATTEVPLDAADGGARAGQYRTTTSGIYEVRLALQDDDGTWHEATAALEVYRDLPFRLAPIDAAQDVDAGHLSRIVIETVDPVTLERVDVLDELDVLVERLEPGGAAVTASTRLAAENTGSGLFRLTHRYPAAGEYRLRFASPDGGFGYHDAPPLQVTVLGDPAANEQDARTPAPGFLFLAAALITGALLQPGRAGARVRRGSRPHLPLRPRR